MNALATYPEARSETAPDSTSRELAGSVLVVDDEPVLRESLRLFLRSHCDVACAASVDEATAILESGSIDLVIMDINMPVKDGIQGLREMHPRWPDLPILILTGFADGETVTEAMELGAKGVLKKPFDLMEMLGTVRGYLGGS